MDIISLNEASTANGRIEKFIENPDSTSGIVTVPKTIASGETITIPAGRVAVLPNVTVDGTLNIDGEVFIPRGSTFGDLDNQIALKADTSYVNAQLGLKANTADLKEIGVGQTWQDVTASRVLGTTYTNSTGKPIMISVVCTVDAGNNSTQLLIGNVIIAYFYDGVVGYHSNTASAIIPAGSTYKITSTTLAFWFELR